MKKNLKKVLAAGLAASMVMGMSVPAFADVSAKDQNNEDITITKEWDDSSATITKYYKLAETSNLNAVSPEETFSFTIVKDDVQDAGVGITSENMPVPEITTSISYGDGDAGKTDKYKKDITINFNDADGNSIYEGVGVYTYKITETAGDTAGVFYYANDISLTVTVVQDSSGLIRVAAVHTEEETEKDAENSTYKLGEFYNTYSAGNLSINKTVTGNMGDQNKYFKVTVEFTAPADTKVNSDIAISSSSYESDEGETNPTIIEGNSWTEESVDLYIKHGETITLSNIPEGVSYTVEEADYTTTDGYDDATYSVDSATATTNSISDTIMVIKDTDDSIDDAVVITNNKGVVVDTGISLDNMPYIMVLAMVALGLVGFVSKKRSMEF